jgi:hypothetical protein
MRYVCDAPERKTWFRIETEAEAARESQAMRHAVEKHFRQAEARAQATWHPGDRPFIERDIGRAAHVRRTMPRFLTLRDPEGAPLVTAMLPPEGDEGEDGLREDGFRAIVVGPDNADPYVGEGAAIRALAEHLHVPLERTRCYPYRR